MLNATDTPDAVVEPKDSKVRLVSSQKDIPGRGGDGGEVGKGGGEEEIEPGEDTVGEDDEGGVVGEVPGGGGGGDVDGEVDVAVGPYSVRRVTLSK